MALEYRLQGEMQYPVLEADEVTAEYGAYGMQRRNFLEANRPAAFMTLMVNGELEQHCLTVDRESREMEQFLIRKMMEERGIDERLKARDQMKWIQEAKAFSFSDAQKEQAVLGLDNGLTEEVVLSYFRIENSAEDMALMRKVAEAAMRRGHVL